MERRKEELEKKRQKLAELRRAREERRAVLESQTAQQQASPSVSNMTRMSGTKLSSPDDYHKLTWPTLFTFVPCT